MARDGEVTLTAAAQSSGLPTLHLQTVAIGRAPPLAFLARSAARSVETDDCGQLRIGRDQAVEQVANLATGVEQSWAFDAPPTGQGPLRVEIDVWGADYQRATDAGLHFSGFRYTNPTWVDADGRSHALPPARFEAGRILLEVPSEVLDASHFPCVLDPLIEPEFFIDEPVYVPVGLRQSAPSVASDGTDFLVAWREEETLFAARVSAAGEVLDKPAIELWTTGPFKEWNYQSSIAFDGQQYLVVWGAGGGIRAARIRPDGTVLDSPAFEVHPSLTANTAPQVASDGSGFLVAFSEPQGAQGLSAVRVGADGAVLGTSVVASGLAAESPGCATDGSGYLVSWVSGAVLLASRLDAAGNVLDPGGFVVSSEAGDPHRPRIAFGADTYFVVWEDTRSPVYGVDVYARRIDTGGTVLGASDIAVAHLLGTQDLPAVAFDGANFAVGYRNGPADAGKDLDVVRFSAAGVAVDPLPVILATQAYDFGIAPGAGGSLFSWSPWTSGPGVQALRLGPDLTPLDSPQPVDLVAVNQDASAAAASANLFLAAWYDSTRIFPFHQTLMAARIDLDGSVLDPTGIAVDASDSLRSVSVASDGQDFLLVFTRLTSTRSSTEEIWAARVGGNGQLVQAPFRLSASTIGISKPRVAWGGSEYLALWDQSGGPRYARISADGAVLDPGGKLLYSRSSAETWMALTFDGTQFVAAVGDERSGGSTIRLFRIDLGGTLQGDAMVPGPYGGDPRLASDGHGGSLVTWTWYSGVSNRGGVARRVDSNLQFPDAQPIALPTATARPRHASFDGRSFVTTWLDDSLELHLARIGSDGALLDPAGILVDAAPQRYEPALASNRADRTLIVQTEEAPAPYRALRVKARIVTAWHDRPIAASCFDGTECASGHCVEGLCCDAACGGSDPTDCQACSVAGGAATDGLCSLLGVDHTCRPAAGVCDIAETCDGTSAACPQDSLLDSTALCRAAIGPCDLDETCTGTSAVCPPDLGGHVGLICRASTGECDAEETCAGAPTCPSDRHSYAICRPSTGPCDFSERCGSAGSECPPDTFLPAGAVCRTARSTCDLPEACSGDSRECPEDLTLADGAACDDHDACTVGDTCRSALCVGSPVACTPPDECHLADCDHTTGFCAATPAPEGTSCSLGWCQSGACVPRPDAAVPDSSLPDANAPFDAAFPPLPDAAGPSDTGGPPDGLVDAGTPLDDAGAADDAERSRDAAGAAADAGAPGDAAGASDSSTHVTGPSGCGCAAAAGAGDLAFAAALVGALAWAPRRRQRE